MSIVDFSQVEIWIRSQNGDRYRIEVILSDPDNYRRHFEPCYLKPKQWISSALPTKDGQALYKWLFADSGLEKIWIAVNEHRPFRLRLCIDTDAPELWTIPWELLQEPLNQGVYRYLAAHGDTPFSRFPAGSWHPIQAIENRPIKILIAIANPVNPAKYKLTPIKVEVEQSIIVDAFSDLAMGQATLTFVKQPVTLSSLETELKSGYDFLHVVAHGRYSDKAKEAVIFLEDEIGETKPESDSNFAGMINRLPEGQKPKFIFLASCQSASLDTADAFRGVAPSLIKNGVPVVLAMQDFIQVNTARQFTCIFYRQLIKHGLIDLATNEARSALLTGKFHGSNIPVLYSRLSDNRLLIQQPGSIIQRKRFEPETVFIPAGQFLMGSDEAEGTPTDEHPQHSVYLPAYRIGKYPITNAEYAAFLNNCKSHPVPTKQWIQRKPPPGKENYPVVAINWYDALAYCRWLCKRTGRSYRLPTEAEWEKAARGTQGLCFPWGNTWETGYNPDINHIVTPVFTSEKNDRQPFHSDGVSPFGCLDMVGNVSEWTKSLWGVDLSSPDFIYEYDAEDGREELDADKSIYRICRGGLIQKSGQVLRCSGRKQAKPESATMVRGFRIVLEV